MSSDIDFDSASDLAEAIDFDHDRLVAVCDAWLASLGVELWPSQSFDLSDDKERPQAAEWLATVLERVDTFARYEYEWVDDDDDDARLRSYGERADDPDVDPYEAAIQWR